MLLRQSIFRKITDVFELHGGVTIDTPVFELKEILSGKYGEDSKLIYDLQDQGGELCSLRYDLTVSLDPPAALKRSEELILSHLARVRNRSPSPASSPSTDPSTPTSSDTTSPRSTAVTSPPCPRVACASSTNA